MTNDPGARGKFGVKMVGGVGRADRAVNNVVTRARA